MAAELPFPEAGMVAAELPEAGMVALCVGIGCAEIIKPLFSFLEGSPARGPVLDAAVLLVIFTVVMAYLAGVILLYLIVTPGAGSPVVLAAFRQFVLLVCALIIFVAYLLSAAGVWHEWK